MLKTLIRITGRRTLNLIRNSNHYPIIKFFTNYIVNDRKNFIIVINYSILGYWKYVKLFFFSILLVFQIFLSQS